MGRIKSIKKIMDNGISNLIFGLLIIALNYANTLYIKGYGKGLFYFAMYFVGIIAIIYGLYKLMIKK